MRPKNSSRGAQHAELPPPKSKQWCKPIGTINDPGSVTLTLTQFPFRNASPFPPIASVHTLLPIPSFYKWRASVCGGGVAGKRAEPPSWARRTPMIGTVLQPTRGPPVWTTHMRSRSTRLHHPSGGAAPLPIPKPCVGQDIRSNRSAGQTDVAATWALPRASLWRTCRGLGCSLPLWQSGQAPHRLGLHTSEAQPPPHPTDPWNPVRRTPPGGGVGGATYHGAAQAGGPLRSAGCPTAQVPKGHAGRYGSTDPSGDEAPHRIAGSGHETRDPETSWWRVTSGWRRSALCAARLYTDGCVPHGTSEGPWGSRGAHGLQPGRRIGLVCGDVRSAPG